MENKTLLSLIEDFRHYSYELGYWTSIWESTPAGVGLSKKELDDLQEKVNTIHSEIIDILGHK